MSWPRSSSTTSDSGHRRLAVAAADAPAASLADNYLFIRWTMGDMGGGDRRRVEIEDFLGQFSPLTFCLVVWGIVFAETGLLLGFLPPGDSLLFAAGLLCARPDSGYRPW